MYGVEHPERYNKQLMPQNCYFYSAENIKKFWDEKFYFSYHYSTIHYPNIFLLGSVVLWRGVALVIDILDPMPMVSLQKEVWILCSKVQL